MARPQDGSSNIRLAIEVNWGQWRKKEREKETERGRKRGKEEGERVQK